MKILIIQESDWFIRGPHNQQHLAERLSLQGDEIRVIDHDILWRTQPLKCIVSKRQVFPDTYRIFANSRITVIRPSFIRIAILDYISMLFTHRGEILRQIREFAPDVIVGFGILNSLVASCLTRKTGIPFVYYWIDLLHTLIPFKVLQPLGKLIERIAISRSDMLIATNKKLQKRIQSMGAKPEKTHVLGFGIDPAKFDPAMDGSEIRNKLGIGSKDVVIFFIGILNILTGVRDVILKLAELKRPDIKFLCAGGGPLEQELNQLRSNLNLKDHLIFTGKVAYNDVPQLIAASDVCLVPFHNVEMMRDIVPLKIFDYMAMGKPVVCTRLPGIVAEFGETNGIVYVDEPAQCLQKAIELCRDNQIASLGKSSRRFVETITWDKITSRFKELLEAAITEKIDRVNCRTLKP